MGPIDIYYHVNTIGSGNYWTRNECPHMKTMGHNGLREENENKTFNPIINPILPVSSQR